MKNSTTCLKFKRKSKPKTNSKHKSKTKYQTITTTSTRKSNTKSNTASTGTLSMPPSTREGKQSDAGKDGCKHMTRAFAQGCGP